MGVLAIDVAILLEGDADRRARELSRALGGPEEDRFRLDDAHLPHLTLLQQGIEEEDLGRALAVLELALLDARALALRASRIATPGTTSHLVIDPHPALQALHARVHAALGALALAVDESSFVDRGEPPRPRDLAWVNGFRERSSLERFEPHVTLGTGPPPSEEVALAFTAARVAACRLGRWCTCREVVREWRLPA